MEKLPSNHTIAESERRQRVAMELACSALLHRLQTFHPRIVEHLQRKNNCKQLLQ